MNTTNSNNEWLIKVVNKIAPFQAKIELVLLAAFLISIALLQFEIESSNLILTIVLTAAIWLYFMLAFSDFKHDKMEHMMHYIMYWGLATLTAGLLFTINMWPGAFMLLVVGLGSVIVATLAQLFFQAEDEKEQKKKNLHFIRIFFVFLFLIGLYVNGNIDQVRDMQKVYQNSEILE